MPETIRTETDNARAYPGSDAQRYNCLDAVERKRERLTNLRVASLNIGTLTGKSREIADMMRRRKINILCLQETRWTGGKSGGKARTIGDGYKLYYSGGGRPRNGVAICLSEEWQERVIATERTSDRIMTMKLVTPERTYNIVTAYAPQQGCEEEEKQRFWNQLEGVTARISATEQLIIAGDLNGHVGADSTEGFGRWHGGKSAGGKNEEGEKILDYARSGDLALVNTFFTKDEEKTYTYKSGLSQTVIDYIMIRREDFGNVKNCKVIPGEPVAPQHRLLVMDYKIRKRRKIVRERPMKINWWKIKEKEGDDLDCKITEMLTEQSEVRDWKWNETYPKIIEAAKETLGVSKGGRYIEKESWWWNEEVQEAVSNKKEAFKDWKRTRSEEDKETMKRLNKISKEKCAIAKEKGYEDLYKDLEENGPKRIYKLARTRQRRAKDIDRIVFIKDEQGKIMSEDKDIKERWKEYFNRLLNTKNRTPEIGDTGVVQGPVEDISEEEVTKQIERMKLNKAKGPDELPVEMIKKLKDTGTAWITSCFREAMRRGIPDEWRKSKVVPLYKQKGDPLSCGNYRGIKLLCHSLKLYERVIESRLRELVKIKDNQYGFQRGKSTTEPMFCLRMLQEKYREFNKELHMVFVDLEKAYDTIPRELIWHCLRKRQVPEAYIEIIKDMYKDSTTRVATNAGETEEIKVEVGLHQGSALSPLLFIIIMDVISDDNGEDTPWSMLFADDLVLCDASRDDLEERLEDWRSRLEDVGLKVSRSKTEYLPPKESRNNIRLMEYDGSAYADLPQCTAFKYLGTTIHQDGGCKTEVQLRISRAWDKWRELTGVLCDKKVPKKLKVLIYKTVIRPVMLYGAETWPLTDYLAERFSVCEMRMLRYCLGISLEEHRTNESIREEANVMNILDMMKRRRLQWFGHVCRREREEDIRKVYELRVEGRRSRGRPKHRWKDTIKKDLQSCSLNEEDAQDRIRWRSLIELGLRQAPATRTGQSGDR